MKRIACVLATAAALMLAAHPASADTKDKVQTAVDGEWISLTGKVKSVSGKWFKLKYGKGTVLVEMDDYDDYNDNFVLPGDEVTVTGRMDHDLFEKRKIEASSVYIPKLNTYFYASAADEEGGYYYAYPIPRRSVLDKAEDGEWVVFSGIVKSIDGKDLMLDTGYRTIKVDTDAVKNNPVDDKGVQFVDVGDKISVTGEMDDADLFEGREVLATSITLLRNNVIR